MSDTRNQAMTKHSLDETLIEVWRQTLVENAKAVKVGRESLSDPQAQFATGGFRIRRKRDSRIGAEPGREIPLGTNGTIRQKGDAVPQRRPIRSERGGWKGDLLRQSTVILNRIEFEALLSFAHGLQPNFPCLL